MAAGEAEINEKARDVLITGYPSYLARRLARIVLREEPEARVRLLVRPDFLDEAAKHIEALPGEQRERVQVLSGDVVHLDLGLSGREYLEVATHVTDVYHIASHWWLGVDRKRIWEVNVRGTRNVIDAAYEMKRLRRLNHFSTAFVSGDRTGVIMEEELDCGQSFRNAFEETKFEAEVLMRKAASQVPISVYRPSIVVGDSSNGEIDKMAGPYHLMNAIVLMPPGVPVLMPGKGDKPLNLVPVDFVCHAMHRISLRDDSAGRTFHLTDPNPLSARLVFALVAEAAGKRAPVGHVPARLARLLMRIPYLERLTRDPRQFVEEFNQLTLYNSIHTVEALDGRLRCPPFPSYCARLIDHIRATEAGLDDLEMPEAGELLG